MPPKMKSVKTMQKPPPLANSTKSSETSKDSDNAIQFELELTWCINSLQNALNSGKLSEKVAEHTIKNLKNLKSTTTPLIKKRQVMKAACGDYRKIMQDEAKKMRLGSKQIKFTTTADTNQKFSFVKKSALLMTGKDFRFNFDVPSESTESTSTSLETPSSNDPDLNSKDLNLNSGSSFKFNFNIDETSDIDFDSLAINK